MRAALIAALALATGCKSPEPPSSFGVDLTVTLDGASRTGLAQVMITVTGAESYAASLPASAFPDGTGQLHYVPGARSGTITIGATAQDGAGAALGAGNSGPIALTDGKSVSATVSVTVGGSAGGDGGAGDMGSGLKVLGAMCGFDNECDSGHCVDGFCCGVASCAQCQNCGDTGACVAVKNKDDNSGMTCSGTKSCDGNGVCKDRWVLFHSDAASSLGGRNTCAGVGNFIFFQGNSGPTRSIDITSTAPAFVNEGSFPGGSSNSYFTSAGSRLYALDLASTATPGLDYLDSTNMSPRMWLPLASPPAWRGEAAFAAGNGKIYEVGGRDPTNVNQKSVYVYDILGNSWTTAGDTLFAIHNAAAAFSGGKLYTFGGDAVVGTSSVTMSFDPSGSGWTNLMASPPSGIYNTAGVAWKGKLAVDSYQTIHTFDPATGMWEASAIPAPTSLQNAYCAAGAGTPLQLYIMGDSSNGTQVWKYNL